MATSKAKANYTKPASQLDLEARQESGNASPLRMTDAPSRVNEPVREDGVRDFRVEGNDVSNYVAVDPIYQNYADDTSKPIAAKSGAEAKVFAEVAKQGKSAKKAASKAEDEKEQDESGADGDSGDSDASTVNGPGTPTTPGSNPNGDKNK